MSTAVQVTAVAQATAAVPWWADWLKLVIGGAITAAGVMGASWINKRRSRPAAQAEIGEQIAGASEKMANSWDKIVARVEEQNEQLTARLGQAEAGLATLRQNIHDRNSWIMAARAFVNRMMEYVHQLETQILDLGGQPPIRPPLPELPEPPSLK